MRAQLTLFPLRGPSRAFLLREAVSQFVGRAPESDLCLEDPRVSARHAMFQWTGGGWVLVDMRSKNGTYVNGARVSEVPLQSGDWISFGGLLARHAQLREADLEAVRQENAARLQRSAEVRRELDAAVKGSVDAAPDEEFWKAFLAAGLELSRTARGFAAMWPGGGSPIVQSAWGYAPFETVDEAFDPLLGAVESILHDGRPVILLRKHDSGQRRRATVEDLGEKAMAAVPLRAAGSEEVRGVLCVEGRVKGGPFTELDAELLEIVAESAGAILAGPARRPSTGQLPRARETAPGAGRPFVEQLDRRLSDVVRAARPS